MQQTPTSIEQIYELSPMQQAMLFHSLYAPGSGVYVLQMSLRLTGRLDGAAFEKAWSHLLARHAILRTAFYWEELDKPLQVVHSHVPLPLGRLSLRGLPPDAQQARLAALLTAERERGFEPTEAPLLRLVLVELADGVHQLLWSLHHLLVDGWSQSLLLRELFACYAAFSAGREPQLARPGSFRDYIAWLQQQDLGQAEAFWRRTLAGFTEPTLLAAAEAQEGEDGFRAARRRDLALPETLSGALREVARRHRLTLNTLVQGAWALVLAEATGRDDVLFGTTVSGRPADLPGVEATLGPFINSLPVRLAVPPDRSLWEWLADLQALQVEMRRHEQASLVEVQRWSELAAGAPLFDHLLVVENVALPGELARPVPGLEIAEEAAHELTNYPLTVIVLPGRELRLTLRWKAGRLEEPAAVRMLERLARLLTAFAADREERLAELPRLLEGERHQALVEWNDTARPYPRDASLAALFEEVARRQPDAPAIVAPDGGIWTWRRLDETANRLARHLRALGVGTETPVGICLERSAELILGTLAIVKAGGAYVPLDAAYPDERLAFMLADTGASVVLVDAATAARLAGLVSRLVALDGGAWHQEPAEALAVYPPAECLAYVIYTSGSTGRPKGVAVPQRAVVRLVRDTDYVQPGPDDRLGQVANSSFDAATYEIWGALLNGGTVVIIPRETVLSPAALAAVLRERRVSSMFLTAALFATMALEEPEAFEGMSELLVGGEAVDPATARRVLAGRPPRRLLNVYGPTESTTFAAWHPIRSVPAAATAIPIGRPLANTTLYVLDRHLSPVPPGAVGELCIGGDGLARGYLGRPELTAERFVPDPRGEGGRLYRSGDLARHLPDGALDCLGRIDRQLKIRGFRIEPGEIEAVLGGHPDVRAAAVGARPGPGGGLRLVAWVAGGKAEALHRFLSERLPPHLVPAAFVILPALPLTPNGKVDRKALPDPEAVTAGNAAAGLSKDQLEELLAGIWSEVLGLPRVGAHDDFFALGGHSLLATQVVSRIRGALGRELPLRQLFETPTVAALADALRTAAGGDEAPPLLPVPRGADLPLSFAQQRLWLIDRLEPGSAAYNIPLALRLRGTVDPALLRRIFAEIVRRHETLRTTFAELDGSPVQRIAPELSPALPLLDLARLPEGAREAQARVLARAEAQRPFDLRRGPLLRLALVRLAPREHLLLWTFHHIVADGWSMGVLLREVAALHTAFSRGEPSPLPPLPVQYADFADWQRRWLRGEVLAGQIDFWRRRLDGAPAVLDLPLDRPRPPVATRRGKALPAALSPRLSEAVLGLGRSRGATPFMVLLAAWATLLGRHAGQQDVVLGSPIAGRHRQEVEGLIGFFVNTLVLRIDLSGNPSFDGLLARVRHTALEAFAHQDLPFERIVEEVVGERDLAVSPLFQVLFAVQNAPQVPALDLPDLSIEPLEVEAGIAKLDLSLTLGEGPDGFHGRLEHATDLFDGATVERLLGRFARLLEGAVATPDGALADLPLLLPGERDQLRAWNATGKAAPHARKRAAGPAHSGPRDALERQLQTIWEELLGVHPVGVHADFFALGGHSLLAARMLSRLRKDLGLELPLRQIFETPTVAGLARALRTAGDGALAAVPPLTPVPRHGPLPLSFAQQRLWLIDQIEPQSAAYNIPLALRLLGDLSVPALQQVFSEIVRRHEALRTTFVQRDEEPEQVIAPPGAVPLPLVDLTPLPASAAAARALAEAEARRPFDLAAGPLLRLLLVRLAGSEHLLLLTLHHIVADGWSLGVLQREMGALYPAAVAGRPSPLPELPVQYADFAVWQRSWLQGEALAAQIGFWKSRLFGAPQVLELPLDHPRPAGQTFRGALHPLALSPALTHALQALCGDHRVTPFMALLAAWAVLLGRHAGQEDVLLGSPIAGRNRRETEGLIGFFVNTLVLRADLLGNPSFSELLTRVRRMALDAFAHQDLPFERIVEEVAGRRDLAVPPLFQVLFTFQNAPEEQALALPGLAVAPVGVATGVAKYDLSFTLGEGAQGFQGALERNTDLFDATTAERLLARFSALLAGAVDAPGRRLADLPLLLPAERHQLLREWNGLSTPAAPGCLHELFAARAARAPQSLAVVDGSRRVSSAELATRAGHLARLLQSHGAGPEVRVAVCLERSMDLIATLLAVLATGAAYVPLDPAYPAERRAFLLEDSAATVLATRRPLAAGLPLGTARLLDLDEAGGAEPDGWPAAPTDPGDLAYVIYTSGSTGRPKGVAIEHRSAVARMAWARAAFSAEELAGVLASTSVCFDLSVFEIFAPLAWGGTVILAENVLELPHLPAAAEVRLVNTVPSAAAELLQDYGLPPGVRTVCLAGEALPAPLAARLYATGTVSRVLNLYGPSEDTTYSTGATVPRDLPTAPPIGRPLPGTCVAVVDRAGRLVPPGVPGELWLGGAGLARGYLGRPDLTAERFTPDPFGDRTDRSDRSDPSDLPGRRVYRTGDLVRFLPDGSLDFLGRIDHQVKLRGFRIEPGEIEAVLASHPEIREAAVLVRGDRLVAWVAPRPTADLAAWLRGKLPAHLVPQALVPLDTLPRTPNGKLDRRALPDPVLPGASEDVPEEAADPTEQLLAQIWAEVLGRERVGVHDDFFALGGHSLLATRAVSRIRATFGVELPFRRLFETPTVAALAGVLRARREDAAPPPLVAVPRDGRPLPLSFAQQRLWLLDRIEPGDTAWNLPAAFRLTGRLDPGLLRRIFAEILRRHEALRTTFDTRDGVPVQVLHPAGPPELGLVDLSGLSAAARPAAAEAALRAWTGGAFDLARGPLLRLGLVRLDAAEHLLALTLHHIVADGWSLGVLVREIAALYEAFAAGRPTPLPDLPVQYADFALWQRAWLDGEVLAAQLDGWRRELAGAPGELALPLDRARGTGPDQEGALVPVELPAALTTALGHLARATGTTPFMLLTAAFQTVLQRCGGQDDVLLATPVAGRGRLETEGLIGFFVNTLVLRGRFGAPGLTFLDLLAQTRATVLAAFERQDLPFDRLVEALVPERRLDLPPLAQVLFALQTATPEPLLLPGLTLEPIPLPAHRAQLDLSLILGPAGETLRGALELRRALFDRVTIERLAASLLCLLDAAVSAPATAVAALPLLTDGQCHQLLREWGGGPPPPGAAASVLERFARQAARAPEAPAVTQGDRRLTYRELAVRAADVAERLRRRGVGPETPVAVVAERTPELVVAFLGILAAGGAYVPVDPAYPAERRAFMLADSGAVVWEEDKDGKDDKVCKDQGRAPERGQAAYILYTSGSTGRPKGVVVSHGALASYAAAVEGIYGIGPGDRVLQFCSTSFDTSLEEIVTCLTGGAELVLRTDEMLASPATFLAACGALGVTVLSLPTAYWHEVAAAVENGAALPTGLRLVILGGERALPSRVAAWRRTAPGSRLLNTYGITESTIVSTAADLAEPTRSEARGEVTIGRPIGGTEVLLCGPDATVVPPGAVGEIHLGGDLLARGYLGRPELTAARFVPHPFAAEPGARLYRTGDLGRRLADGTLEFAGRADRQVKVRGYRIEIEEIEAALARHPEVAGSAVAVREERPGEKVLTAWVVPRTPGAAPAPATLRAFLRESLPDPLVPTSWVPLAALPLTPNGKLDRRALPPPADRAADAEPPAAPADPVEELLAGIWAEVLGRERVGVHEDFFVLGGHSLLAAQVISRLRAALGVEVPLRRLFERPTVAELARAVRTAPAESLPPLTRVPRDGTPLPLSLAQQRLWLVDRLDPGSPAYNLPFAARLTGALDAGLLARVFTEIVRRHEALRTTFGVDAGEPVQRIAAPGDPGLARIDLSALPEAPREATAAALAAAEARRPFDLERGPLLRLALVRLGGREHVLLLTLHHVVADGWSIGVLLQEIAALAAAFSAGRPSPLPELPVQAADHAVWQRSWLQGRALDERLAWWRQELAGAPPELPLPVDRPRGWIGGPGGPADPAAGGLVRTVLPAEFAGSLQALARRRAVTPFMVLLAAFAALLHRLGGADDLLVGTPGAGRQPLEIEGLIGFFVNTLVIRARCPEPKPFSDLLAQIRGAVLGAFEHQDLPFDRLVEELVPRRVPGLPPLVQVSFSMPPAAVPFVLPGLEIAGASPPTGRAQLDLGLDLHEHAGGFIAQLDFTRALFDPPTATRLLDGFVHLLRAALAAPDLQIAELPLLGAPEIHQILREWNDTGDLPSPEPSILAAFARQVARTPDAVALSAPGCSCTYAALDRRSDQVARELLRRGAAPETRVAVTAERTPALIAAFLGILKAGCVYVPLDPAYPADRRGFMQADAGGMLLEVAAKDCKDGEDGRDSRRFPEAAQLAYLLYTSGSTGRPKGVMVSHGALAAFAAAVRELYGIGPGDRVLQFCSTSFDTSLEEIVVALTTGAELVLRSEAMLASPAAFLEACGALGITMLSLPTAWWSEIAAQLEPGRLTLPANLRLVIIGGEKALAVHAAGWRRAAPGRPRLLNSYGVTEVTIASTAGDLAAVPLTSGEVPVGRPLAGAEILLLDRAGAPVPIGTAGEIHLGGALLARGYQNRPEATAERFVPHPFATEPGARLYRSGDLGRARPDGTLEILGRRDGQVKIRGYRIETGEIEARLLEHPEIAAAAVDVREDRPGDRRIAAWVVPRLHPAPTAAALRAFVREALPEPMVPASITALDALPLTPNGKLDRAALPTPAPDPQAETVAPRGEMETRLLRLWEEVLPGPALGVRDDFFELGGHSLLAVRLAARIESAFGRPLPLADLLRHPTIEALALHLQGEATAQESTSLVELARGPGRPLFLVHPVGGEVLCYAALARRLDRPVYGLQALDAPRSLEEMAALYLEEVRAVQPEGPYEVGGWSLGGAVAYEMARRLEHAGERVDRVVLLDAPAPGDLRPEDLDEEALAAAFADDLVRLLGAEAAGREADAARRFAVFRANLRALAGYTPGPCGAPLLLLRAAEPAGGLPDLGWERVAGHPVATRELPGDHYSLLREPAVAALAAALSPP